MQDPMAYPLAQDGGWVGDSTCHGGEWAPYAQHIEAGRFEVKTGVAEHEDGSHAFSQAKFTAKGVEWIAGEWAKAQVRGAA